MRSSAGPQQDRTKKTSMNSKLRNNRESDLGALDNRELLSPVDFHAQEQTYQEKIQYLTRDNSFLKEYVEKILKELKRVLIKHGEADALNMHSNQVLQHDPLLEDPVGNAGPPWFTNEEYMNPLLMAYDARIKELEKSCHETDKHVEAFMNQAESITKENEHLKSELENAVRKLVQKAEVHGTTPSSSTSVMTSEAGGFHAVPDAEIIAELNERIDILVSENNLIMEQNTAQETQLDEDRDEIELKDHQLVDMTHKFNHATNYVRELRDKIQTLGNQKQECERRLQFFAASVAKFETEKELSTAHQAAQDTLIANLKTNVRDQGLALESVKTKNKRAEQDLTKKYQTLTSRLVELTTLLEDQERENDARRETISGLETELSTSQKDCEGMLNVLSGMEKQLADYTTREEAVTTLEKECTAKIEEALLDRDQARTGETQGRREIARLLEKRRQDAAENIKMQQEAIDAVRKRMQTQLDQKENDVQSLQEQLVRVQAEQEKTIRSEANVQKEHNRFKNIVDKERLASKDQFTHLLKRISEAEATRDQIQQDQIKQDQLMQSKTQDYQTQLSEVKMNHDLVQDQCTALEREVEVRRSELRELQQDKDDKDRRVDSLMRQVAEVKVEGAAQLAKQRELYETQIQSLKERLYVVEGEMTKLQELDIKREKTTRQELERSRVRSNAELDQMQSTLLRLREEKLRLETQNADLNAKKNEFHSRAQNLDQSLVDAEAQQNQLQLLLDDSERKASDLSAQLSASLSKQQQQLRTEKETRTALDRMKLEKTRLEREVQNVHTRRAQKRS